MTKVCHPPSVNFFASIASRSRVFLNFNAHIPVCVWGMCAILQPWCWCQKHPLTKIAVLYLGKTMSGCPGSVFTCNRKRKPRWWSHLRTAISGFVSFERIWDIIRLLAVFDTVSMVVLTPSGIPRFAGSILLSGGATSPASPSKGRRLPVPSSEGGAIKWGPPLASLLPHLTLLELNNHLPSRR